MNQWTALHWAAHRSQHQIVEFLLARGADPTVKNSQGKTPADLAKHNQTREVFGLDSVESCLDDASSSFVPNYLQNPEISKTWKTLQDHPISAERTLAPVAPSLKRGSDSVDGVSSIKKVRENSQRILVRFSSYRL